MNPSSIVYVEVRQLLRSGTGGRCLAKTRACGHVSTGTSRSQEARRSTASTAAAVSAASGAAEWTATARKRWRAYLTLDDQLATYRPLS
jgi:hypothetical protein